ncbi:winged helix-turn-helix transcriptional regulator [Streptomyces scopuliridis]|uniref:winged helix-turn-helix transcriptional regulator n=1 Tax=Streptomyces scopuliridis TaxID=452529 RepID=UPI003684271E
MIGTLGDGLLRYTDLQRAIPGISQRMLTLTLKHLVRDGLVDRAAYPEVPPRVPDLYDRHHTGTGTPATLSSGRRSRTSGAPYLVRLNSPIVALNSSPSTSSA